MPTDGMVEPTMKEAEEVKDDKSAKEEKSKDK